MPVPAGLPHCARWRASCGECAAAAAAGPASRLRKHRGHQLAAALFSHVVTFPTFPDVPTDQEPARVTHPAARPPGGHSSDAPQPSQVRWRLRGGARQAAAAPCCHCWEPPPRCLPAHAAAHACSGEATAALCGLCAACQASRRLPALPPRALQTAPPHGGAGGQLGDHLCDWREEQAARDGLGWVARPCCRCTWTK